VKKKLLWISLGIVTLLVIVVGYVAATFQVPEFAGMDEIEIQELEGHDLHAEAKGRIYNGNFFAITARNLEYVVTYQDTVLGRGKLKEGFSLAAGDTTLVTLPLELGLEAICAVHTSMLKQRRCKIDIHLEGEYTSLHYAQGLDFSTEIDPDEFLKQVVGHSLGSSPISFEELTWKAGNLKTSEFSFVSVIMNHLDLPLELKAMTLIFYAEGENSAPAGDWKLDKPVPLQPKYSTRIPGTVKIHHLEAGKGAITTIFTGEIRYRTEGTLTLKLADLEFEIPIDGTVAFDPKTGTGRWE
jgi:LEA14-like dessication related protein